MLALPLGLAFEGLPVGDSRSDQFCLYSELASQAADNHLEVTLAAAAHDRLSQLSVEFVMKGGILLVQLVESRSEFVFFAALLNRDRHDDQWIGKRYLR